MQQLARSRSILWYFERVLCCIFIYIASVSDVYGQPGNAKVVSQRFFMQVDDLLDLGFINEQEGYTDTDPSDLRDIINEGKEPEFEFRIRTNEPYMLTIQTVAEDSMGSTDADSILQVKLLVGNGDNNESDDYKNINNKPTKLIDDNSKLLDKKLKIKYRAKPGATIPPELKKLKLVFTASYP